MHAYIRCRKNLFIVGSRTPLIARTRLFFKVLRRNDHRADCMVCMYPVYFRQDRRKKFISFIYNNSYLIYKIYLKRENRLSNLFFFSSFLENVKSLLVISQFGHNICMYVYHWKAMLRNHRCSQCFTSSSVFHRIKENSSSMYNRSLNSHTLHAKHRLSCVSCYRSYYNQNELLAGPCCKI